MSNLIQHSLHLTENNLKKIANSIEKSLPVTLQFLNKHLNGSHPMMLLKTQLGKINKAIKTGKGLRMNFSASHLKKMTKHGGFLAALLPFLAETVLPALTGTVLPALASGALGGLATYGVNKAIKAAEGNGLSNFGQVSSGGCAAPKLIGGSLKGNKTKKKQGMGIYQFGTLPRK